MASGFSGETYTLVHNNVEQFQELCQKPKKGVATKVESTCGWAGDFILLVELQKQILIFRDFIDLPPCDHSVPIHELMIGTVEDLHKLYPDVVSANLNSGRVEISVRQGLIHLYRALRSVSNLWAKNMWIANTGDIDEDGIDSVDLDQLVLAKLHQMINIAKELFDVMDEDEEISDSNKKSNVFGEILNESCLDNKSTCPSPDTPTSLLPELNPSMRLPEFTGITFRPPFLLPLHIQSVKQLKLFDMEVFPILHPFSCTNGARITNTESKSTTCVKLLWRAFQLAFRDYNFAGGQDDRADQLTQRLADEIEADPL